MMDWDWNKINGTKNVPDFDKVVLLIEKRDNDKAVQACTGSLKSIDSNGSHWSFGGLPNPFDMFSMFGGATSSGLGGDKEKFTPTHWIEVQLPKE